VIHVRPQIRPRREKCVEAGGLPEQVRFRRAGDEVECRGSASSAEARPTIAISGVLTQPVFSYQDAIREYVRVQSPVDSDGDGNKDLVRVDIIRPKETKSGLKVPVIMHESPYFDEPRAGFESDHPAPGPRSPSTWPAVRFRCR
jgi:hypothetical protein